MDIAQYNKLSTGQDIGKPGAFCKGHVINTGAGFVYLICKAIHKPSDRYLPQPLLDVQANRIFGEQYLRQLDPYKNSFDILRKLYLYAHAGDTGLTATELDLSRMHDDDIINEIALLLEQHQLLMIQLHSPFGNAEYSVYSDVIADVPEERERRDLTPERTEIKPTEIAPEFRFSV